MSFYLLKLTVFFGNRQQSNASAGQKKTHRFLLMRSLNLPFKDYCTHSDFNYLMCLLK